MINGPPCHHLSKPAMIYWFLYLSHKKKRTLALRPSFTLSLSLSVCQLANTNQQWANCCLMWKREFLSWSIGEDSKIESKPNASLHPLYHMLCLFFDPCISLWGFLRFVPYLLTYVFCYHICFSGHNSLHRFRCLFVFVGKNIIFMDLMWQNHKMSS